MEELERLRKLEARLPKCPCGLEDFPEICSATGCWACIDKTIEVALEQVKMKVYNEAVSK